MNVWKGPPLPPIKGYAMCFGCGMENPIGLRLRFRKDGEGVRGEFTPGESHQGWPGIVHGGIINCLLDEAMGYGPFFEGIHCVTAKMEVRLRHPAEVGQQLIISSHVTRKTRKLIEAVADIALEDGTVVAESRATMYIVNDT